MIYACGTSIASRDGMSRENPNIEAPPDEDSESDRPAPPGETTPEPVGLPADEGEELPARHDPVSIGDPVTDERKRFVRP
jgi:hypothetical protein